MGGNDSGDEVVTETPIEQDGQSEANKAAEDDAKKADKNAKRKETRAAKAAAKKVAGDVQYFAGGSLKLTRDGKSVIVKAGDAVPEAAGWRNLNAYLRRGRIVGISNGVPVRYSRKHVHRLGREAAAEVRKQQHASRLSSSKMARQSCAIARAAGRVQKPDAPGGADRQTTMAGGGAPKQKRRGRTTRKTG